jgi:predicted membrane metal-binding protein
LSGINLVAAAIIGYAGLASIRRWRGWRIWASAAAQCLIAFVVLSLFATPPPPGSDRSIDRVMFS